VFDMAFSSANDFFAMFRTNTSGGVDTLRMPIIDAMLQTLADNGLINVSAGTTAPVTNQATTIWLNTQVPSYNGPSSVLLWNAATSAYVPATPALFAALLNAALGASQILEINDANAAMNANNLVANYDTLTASRTIVLPALSAAQAGVDYVISDFSGNCSPAVSITAVTAGSGQYIGPNGNTSYELATAWGTV
jgi:hypothetical protein